MANQVNSQSIPYRPLFWLFEAFGQVIRIEQSSTIQTKAQAEQKAIQIAKGLQVTKLFKLFTYLSTIGFWYLILPPHWHALMIYLAVSMLIAIPLLVIMHYVVNQLVFILRKRYTWASKLFISPRRY